MNNRRERGGNTTWFQREAMLQWLEVETNFKNAVLTLIGMLRQLNQDLELTKSSILIQRRNLKTL